MNLFFCRNIQDNIATLDETESHHCIKVLRLNTGDEICIVDGKGGYFEGLISIPDHRNCSIEIKKSQFETGKRDYKLHVAMAPTKNIERFEWFLEKSTEIGIDQITPLLCSRSERKILRIDRLEKVITSAMKQSLKAYHPVLHPLTEFDTFVKSENTGEKLIAHCMEGTKQDLIKMKNTGNNFTILIGPEGDFTSQELDLAISRGFLPVSLGSSRLRTETAGIASCQIIADLMSLK